MCQNDILLSMKDKLKKNRKIVCAALFICVVILISTFLRIQMDDERVFGFYEFENVQDDAYDAEKGIITAKESFLKKGDIICTIPDMCLESGKYILQIDHQQDNDSSVQLLEGNKVIADFELISSELDSSFSFDTDTNLYDFTVRFIYEGGEVSIKKAYIRSQGLFYTDNLLIGGLLIFSVILLTFFAVKTDFSSISHRKQIFYLLFPAFFIFLNFYFFREYDYSMAGDAGFHVAIIEQTKNELLRGQFPVQIYGDALGGKGVLGTLYPNLFTYFPALLRILHISMEATVRIFFIFINLGTMITSYYTVKKISGNKNAAVLGMIIYTTLPYRMGLLYFRFATGEILSMIWFPFVILGMYEIIIGSKERWYFLAAGISGILQSHILSTVMVTGFCFLIILMNITQLLKERRIIALVKAAIATLLLNLWYIVPFWEYYKYDLKLKEMFAVMDFSSVSNWPSQLFTIFTPFHSLGVDYRTPMLGLSLWFFMVLLIYYFLFNTEENKGNRFIFALFTVSLCYFYMSTKAFPWQTLQKFEMIKRVVTMIQFPIRFGQMAQAGLTIAGAVILSYCGIYRKYSKQIAVFCILSSCLMMIVIGDASSKSYKYEDIAKKKFIPNIQESNYEDYVPKGYAGDNWTGEPISDTEIKGWLKKGTFAEFDYASEKNSFAMLPIMAYPGYIATDGNGKELKLEKGDYAMLKVDLPKAEEMTHVYIRYVQPVRWRICLIISITVFIMMILCLIYKNKDIKIMNRKKL